MPASVRHNADIEICGDGGFLSRLSANGLTSDRTHALPDASGTLMLEGASGIGGTDDVTPWPHSDMDTDSLLTPNGYYYVASAAGSIANAPQATGIWIVRHQIGSATLKGASQVAWPVLDGAYGTWFRVSQPGGSGGSLLVWGAWQRVGSVTSVGLSLPSVFSVSGSPVTGSGTLTATLASQSANLVWASPDGSAGAPVFRTLAAADIPSLTLAKIADAGTAAAKNTGTTAGTVPLNGAGASFSTLATSGNPTFGSGANATLTIALGGECDLNYTRNTAGSAIYDFVARDNLNDGTQGQFYRFGLGGNASFASAQGFKADAGTTVEWQLGMNGTLATFVCRSGGNFGVGTPSPSAKLDVAGAIKAATYTFATLPAGAFGMSTYISDCNQTLAAGIGTAAAGGGANRVPVWHDGTQWIIG